MYFFLLISKLISINTFVVLSLSYLSLKQTGSSLNILIYFLPTQMVYNMYDVNRSKYLFVLYNIVYSFAFIFIPLIQDKIVFTDVAITKHYVPSNFTL